MAVIFAKCDLTLGGGGSLSVKDTVGHGIVSKDDLVVTGGTYTIESQDHCLNGKDSVRIADGTFTLTCDEDGIHAGNDDQQDGYIYIEDGDIDLSVGDDAMHAEGLLIITGGDIDISKSYEGIEGYKILVTGGDIDVAASDDGFNAAGGSSGGSGDNKDGSSHGAGDNKGGFGGDHGVDVNGNTPLARPDGNGQSDDRPNLPENEGQPESGDMPDGSGMPGGSGVSDGSDKSGGPAMGGVDMDADCDAYILITGGTININADGDGIDTNGYLGISGGSVYVLGPSNSGNGALDYGIYATIAGGEIVAVGGSGMAQGFGDESTQCSALVSFDEWIDAGETITLAGSDGKEVLSYTAGKKFNSVVISTSDMKQGETYTLTAGDQSSTFTLDDITYSDDSGGMQSSDSGSGKGDVQVPGGNRDNGQNNSSNEKSQNTDSSSSSDSISI